MAVVQYNHLVVLADCTADDPQTSDMIILIIFTTDVFGHRSHVPDVATPSNSAQPQMEEKSQPHGPYHRAYLCQ